MKFSTILAIPLLFAGLPAAAQAPQPQTVQMVPRPTPDADALAAAMRRIGANPRDLSSLIEAGELSLKLGDPTAAASLFKRAEQVDPMNGRVKAGMARILVQQERPGEALRFFDQAAGYGLDARSFAGDRGLAYDLIGDQARAQRDYVSALAAGPEEEVQRRYALSLAISGKQADALKQIDPLLRQSDRGAWRTRAFILAMGGDLSGATDIATRMMPPGMATGLQPFFKTLPSLGPVDRAFAVHFGEIRATPARLADARLAPALPALPATNAAAPVTLAQAAAPVLRADMRKRDTRQRRESARDRRQQQQSPVQVATAKSAAAAPLPEAPRYGSMNGVTFAAPREVAQTVPTQPVPVTVPVQPVAPVPGSAPVRVAQAPATDPRPVAPAATLPTGTIALGPSTAVPRAMAQAKTAPAAAAPQAAPVPTIASAPSVAPTPTPALPSASQAAVAATSSPNPSNTLPPARVATASITPVAPRMSEDSILARIIAGISIPAEELGVAPVRRAAVVAAPVAAPPTPTVSAPPPRLASAEPAPRAAALAVKAVVAKPGPAPTPAAKATPTVDLKVAARKAAADKKAAAAKKLADAEKLAAAKKLADEKKAAKADPARIWVQVAGGANAGDLARAWKTTQGKAAALSGKQAYTTPLRATNRVVTGPFKTDAEARAMVNTLAKQGVSAFTFTSEAGQKLTKIPPK